jgi:hypothetical protein
MIASSNIVSQMGVNGHEANLEAISILVASHRIDAGCFLSEIKLLAVRSICAAVLLVQHFFCDTLVRCVLIQGFSCLLEHAHDLRDRHSTRIIFRYDRPTEDTLISTEVSREQLSPGSLMINLAKTVTFGRHFLRKPLGRSAQKQARSLG